MNRALEILAGLCFCTSAVLKLSDLESFKLYLYTLIPVPYTLIEVGVYLLLGLEFGIGLCLVLKIATREASVTGLAMLCAFSAFLVWRIAIGDDGNCHCFGSKLQMSPTVSLIKNGILAIMLIPGLSTGRTTGRGRQLAIAITLAAALVSGAVSIPDFMVKEPKTEELVDEDLFKAYLETTDYYDKDVLVSFVSIHCKYCKKYMTKLSTHVSHGAIPEKDIRTVLLDEGESTEEISAFFNDYTGGKHFPYDLLPADTFLPIIRGSMPTGIYIKDGQIRKAVNLISL